MKVDQSIFSSSPNGILIVAENGTISQVNPAAEKIFQSTNHEIEGYEFSEFLLDHGVTEKNILKSCTAASPYTAALKAVTKNDDTLFLDVRVSLDPSAGPADRYLVFVNDITAQKEREEELQRAHAGEATLKKIQRTCHEVENLGDTLKHALKLTVALPDIKAVQRAVILATENDTQQLELIAHLGLGPKDLQTLFKKDENGTYSLDNSNKQIEILSKSLAGKNYSYHAIIEGDTQTVVLVISLQEKISNAVTYENLNSVADVLADTIEREKLKKSQSTLIADLDDSS